VRRGRKNSKAEKRVKGGSLYRKLEFQLNAGPEWRMELIGIARECDQFDQLLHSED
jgi:hypothetical protein